MAPLPFAANVFMDPASTIAWDQLHQTEFLALFFVALRDAMDGDFTAYRFFVYSPSDPAALPASASLDLPNKVLFFLSDESPFIPWHLRQYYSAVFKAHLPFEVEGNGIFPFNLGYMRNVPQVRCVPIGERPIDVFFSGNLNVNRCPLYRALNARAGRSTGLRHPKVIAALLRSPLRRRLRQAPRVRPPVRAGALRPGRARAAG